MPMNETDLGPGGSYGVAMDGNDPMTQYYLQMSDEAVSEQQQRQQAKQQTRGQGSRASPAAQILRSRTSGDLYEGDDELDEDTTLAQSQSITQTAPEDTENENPSPTPMVMATSTNRSEEVVVDNEDGGLDFVHVHLEHLPSKDDVQQHHSMMGTAEQPYQIKENIDTEETKGDENEPLSTPFSFYRKFAVEGSHSLPNSGSLHTHAETNHVHVIDVDPTTSNEEHHDKYNLKNPEVITVHSSESAAYPTSERTEEAMRVEKHYYQSRNSGFHRQQALQGNLHHDEQDDAQTRYHQFDEVEELRRQGSGQFRGDAPTTSDFELVSVNTMQDDNYLQQSSDQRTDNRGSRKYEPPRMTESDTQNATEEETPPSTTKGVHFSTSDDNQYDRTEEQHIHTDTSHPAPSMTSEGDDDDTYIEDVDRRKHERERRMERLMKRREKKFRMTLLQTMQHNTRANFCAIFLLGVAMATLVLLIVAKITSSNHEDMFYDEDKDQSFVVTNNESLMTVEILAFALIMVLLFGSVCYLGAATYDTTNSLVRSVKHEDACLANSSARRKHATYSAPYVQDGSPSRRYAGTDTEQQSNLEEQDLQDQTFSMISSSGGAANDDDDDDVLISMEEADQIYRELEERAVCCSPLSLHASTEELECPTEEDRMTDEERHQGSRHNTEDDGDSGSKVHSGVLS